MTLTNENTDTDRLSTCGGGTDNEPGFTIPEGTTSEASTPLQRTSARLFEDSTPTPSRTASPRRPNSAQAARTSDSEALHTRESNPSGRAKRRGRAGTGPRRDSPTSRSSSPAASAGFYDSLLPSNRASSSETKPIDSKSRFTDDDADQVHMPSSSGGTGAPTSHDDGRQGAGSSSDTTRPHGAPRTQLAHPAGQPSPSAAGGRRQQQGRQIYATPPVQYYTSPPSEGYQNPPSSSAPPPQPPAISTTYSTAISPAAYQARSGYMGQYTMSPQPGPPQSLSYSQPQYPYAAALHHPGIASPDPGLAAPQFPSIGYPSGPPLTHGPPPPAQSRAPTIYPFPRYSPEGAPSSNAPPPFHQVHTSSPSEHLPYDPSPPSGSPHPQQHSHSSSPYSPQHASPSFSSFSYSTVPTTHQFSGYARESFPGHSTPFQPQYAHSYTYMGHSTPEEPAQHQAGTWWYIPPGASASGPPPTGSPYDRSYQGMYAVGGYAQRPDLDAYGNPTSLVSQTSGGSSAQFPTSPQSIRSPSTFSGPTSGTPHPSGTAASLPGSTREDQGGPGSSHGTMSAGAGARALGMRGNAEQSGESGSEKGLVRRSYHPNPPAQRSEWVMWVGNVPSDATHDELWRFFKQPAHKIGSQIPPSVSQTSLVSQPPHLPAGLLSPEGSDTYGESSTLTNDGVASVFLISRSNCAFVNYTTEAHLQEAVKRFNGIPLRPNDPRCPKLVCRVRGREDDLRAGVGGQRGQGIHQRWVKEQREKERERKGGSGAGKGKGKERTGDEQESTEAEDQSSEPPATPSDIGDPGSSPVAHSFSSTEDSIRQPPSTRSSGSAPKHHSSSSSTTSSFLQRHFPKRYFILKSLTQYDLNISKEKGVWATQPHNEEVLNQAYRTSHDVYLIFSVNKSGEFFGYARMAGPIGKQGERVSWASRTSSSHSHSPSASLSSSGKPTGIEQTIPEEREERTPGVGSSVLKGIFSPNEHRLVEDSPQPFSPFDQQRLDAASKGNPLTAPAGENERAITHAEPAFSAPAEVHSHHRRITLPNAIVTAETFDPNALRKPPLPKLDPKAPLRAVREQAESDRYPAVATVDEDGVKRKDTVVPLTDRRTQTNPLPAGAHSPTARPPEAGFTFRDAIGEGDAQWGTPFKVQWVKATPLPFYRTRQLRNPWNHDREVKVSRDGTELEPTVGEALLQEWEKPEPAPTSPASPAVNRRAQRTPFRGGAQAESPMPGTQGSQQQQHTRSHGGAGDRGRS